VTLNDHKKRLLGLRAELLAEGDEPIEPAEDQGVISKPDEDAQPLVEMGQVIASSRNRARTQVLERIQVALGRLDSDPASFGQCLECGEDIAPRRLQLMPYVELCVECQQARDQPQGPTGRRHLRNFR